MPTDPDSRTRLHGLKVREVSLVDHPANEEVFLLIKHIEGHPMLKTDTPLLKAAADANAKNEAEKDAAAKAEKNDHYGDMAKVASMAMDYLKAMMSMDPAKIAESNEAKSLMAALEALVSAASKAPSAPAEKMDHDDKKEDEEKAEDAKKMDHDDKKEDEEKAEKTDAAPAAPAAAAAPSPDLSEIKSLLASLQSKLGNGDEAQKAQEAAVAKGFTSITERLDRMAERVSTVEKARGISRGEGDAKVELSKSDVQSIFAGVI